MNTIVVKYRHQLVLSLLLMVVFIVGILTLPALIYTGDPYTWREEARAIVLHGRLSIPEDVATSFAEPGHFFVYNNSDGKWYSRYGVLNGFWNAIPMLAEKLITGDLPPFDSPHRELILGVFFVFQAMLIAFFLYRITGYYSENLAARFAFVCLAFYTTYLWNYLRCTNSEATQLLVFLIAYFFFLRFERQSEPADKRPWHNMYYAWGALWALCLTKISYLTFLPLFALLLIYYFARNGVARTFWRKFIIEGIIAPVLIIVAAQAAVQTLKFGSPLLTGYHQFKDPTITHTMWEATTDYIYGWQGSLFIHFPLLLLALTGMRRFAREHRYDMLYILGALLITYLLTAYPNGPWRGEWAYGPRYFIPILPLLSLPALYALEWMFSRPLALPRIVALTAGAAASVFLVMVQMEINRLDFFFRYRIEIRAQNPAVVPPEIAYYFTHTNYAKINWDHMQCQGGHWDRLPYFAALQRHARPQDIQVWQHFIELQTSRSNLYCFPDNTKWQE